MKFKPEIETSSRRQNRRTTRLAAAFLVGATALLLSACGGSGNSTVASGGAGSGGSTDTGSGGGGSVSPTTTTLSGVAATGAPFAGAAVTVTDSTGTTVCSTTTAADGSYSCTLPASTAAPLVIRAVRDDQALYSVTASSATGTANVTPLTTIIVARLASDGNPASLAGTIQTTPATVTAATLQTQVDALKTALAPVLALLGQTIDPISGVFAADGSGQDKVLDALSITVRPNGSSANIEISVKTSSSDAVFVAFDSSAATIPPLPVTSTTTVATVPTPAILADLASRMTACYALPLSQRVNAGSDTGNSIGEPANVIAPVCRQLFVGNDPATYYNSGLHVGRDANNGGAFASLFRSGATGLVWDRFNVEFVRSNGDYVITYRTTDATATTDTNTLVLRLADGSLKLSGNGNAYSAAVNAYSEDRELVNTPAFSYFTTGYNINVPNVVDSNGNSIFTKVEVTSPFPNQPKLTLLPTAGLSFMAIAQNGVASGTNILRLAAVYADSGKSGNPASLDPLVYTPTQYTDATIAAVPNQGVWTVEFFHVDGRTNVVQTTRTISRAETLGEVKQRVFVQLTAGMRTEIRADSGANGYHLFGTSTVADPNNIDFSQDNNGDAWMVPTFALAPTSLSVNGRAPFGSTTAGQQGARFNDSTGLASTARKGIIYCAPQTSSDRHCSTNSLGFSEYAAGSSFNLLELSVRSPRQIIVSKKVAVYKLADPS
ncbi:carboxypeptidase regulatory-like domain-containing protein [Xylophilus rhododendri]|uniref:Carboxypeptidase regulatory-like domain-containing protein n=1 Tax=Xylophilus rhododendri TaxID=2697032 RepID=A0A857J973_9BURK|nr:carboxypeptidase regulatory-like domain-containing protein [Xylophilus rhododendri]QHJ00535.1 carboxypeptidase regulatory-like domain-containing protein [Xylophilus rhododendri]